MTRPYAVGFRRVSWRQYEKLDRPVADMILKRLFTFAQNADIEPLHPLTGQWKGFYKLRVGDYRVIYELETNERLIIIEAVGHRREIYDE